MPSGPESRWVITRNMHVPHWPNHQVNVLAVLLQNLSWVWNTYTQWSRMQYRRFDTFLTKGHSIQNQPGGSWFSQKRNSWTSDENASILFSLQHNCLHFSDTLLLILLFLNDHFGFNELVQLCQDHAFAALVRSHDMRKYKFTWYAQI